MAEAGTLNEKVAALLCAEPGRRWTAQEIARTLDERYPDWAERKKANTTQNTNIIQQLVAEIGRSRPSLQSRHDHIRTTTDRPRQYYWLSDLQEATGPIDIGSRPKKNDKPREIDLYSRLSTYLRHELRVWPKRIDERSARKAVGGANRWLFPDLVAMEPRAADWPSRVRDLMHEMSGRRARLWSFEVKRALNVSTVREAFFQTVSNSSWANFGYLVTVEIEDEAALAELRVLAGLHGIGVIRLDPADPTESEIVIPARERPEVDWASLARLAQESRDFAEFVDAVMESLRAGQPLTNLFGPVSS